MTDERWIEPQSPAFADRLERLAREQGLFLRREGNRIYFYGTIHVPPDLPDEGLA